MFQGEEMINSILSYRERAKMQDLIAHSHEARQTLRAYALLWLDDGESVPEVARRLGVTRQTVYNWASRFQARTDLKLAVRLLDAPRCGRPCTATGWCARSRPSCCATTPKASPTQSSSSAV